MVNLTMRFAILFAGVLFLWGCGEAPKTQEAIPIIENTTPSIAPSMRFGLNLNTFETTTKKIKRGDTFGSILEANGIDYPQVHAIISAIKDSVNVRKLQLNKPYTLFFSKDSLKQLSYFVYHPNVQDYTIIQLKDSVYGKKVSKAITIKEMEAVGTIQSSLYETMKSIGVNDALTYYLADVYAWTIDFSRLYPGDRFKVIYEERFVNDTLSVGINKVKAAYFEHQGKPFYAFEFESDPEKGIIDYFDDQAKNLRRAFLKAPVKFSRISSRYNLRRRIAYYGNRVRPHKGTDFAANVGTPILATAKGVVVKASYTKGNGNYVTIRHNETYSTQYLHMNKRKVRKGQKVEQGDVIGWVGMTGNTSGPHVCYRFWKNGKQVDPFKQKLPEAKPISSALKAKFMVAMQPIKEQLDCIAFDEKAPTNQTITYQEKPIE
jgi:murein DD-endopeptidase MepM/ murein hydrolase activator NlpD